MNLDDTKFIHIVGMHKSGTSWLSHILSAHPQVIGWREFDIIRATYKEDVSPLLSRAIRRYELVRNLSPRKTAEIQFSLKEKREIIRDVFCGRGWIPIMDASRREAAENHDQMDTESFIDYLMALAGKSLGHDNRPLLKPDRFTNKLGIANSRRRDLCDFLDSIKQSEDLTVVPSLFFSYLQSQCEPGTYIALKAADQGLCFEQLQAVSPHSKKIAIIRDGRDAAISAKHYGDLMRTVEAPWVPNKRSFLSQLRAWVVRVRILSEYAEKNSLILMRYEDLKRDFLGVTSSLFGLLDLPLSQEKLIEIHQMTDFSTVTGGREPGESAEHIVRKGIIGEWSSVLTQKHADLAWKIAGPELEKFGYSRTGEYNDDLGGLVLKGHCR